ncbi:MAG TPA: hypothetical protein VFR03_10425 [Thermoanaerobaculia bacterium]|nr:hypothetical protein [Thermoanaerobaculia bacterium]
MVHLNMLVLLAGFAAYFVSLVASTALVLLFLRLNVRLFPKQNVLKLFHWDPSSGEPAPSPAPAIALGAATLSQAYLLRHVVFVIMTLVRDFLVERGDSLFTGGVPASSVLKLIGQSFFVLIVLCILSVISIWIAGGLFNLMTGEVKEMQEILAGNIAVAILFAFVLFAITTLLDLGIQDISRALIPYNRPGVVRIQ